MCQLLGLNANNPADIVFSFTGFRERGGNTDDHKDGFGIAFFEQNPTVTGDSKLSLRSFYDDKPSAISPLADFINEHPVKSLNTICHIRKASDGGTGLMNNHPFVRELWGEQWAFAHNGQMVQNFVDQLPKVNRIYQPVGMTDSEQAFCYLLNRLRQAYDHKPNARELYKALRKICDELGNVGIFNALLSNGEWQLVYANTLMFYIDRHAPFGKATLSDKDVSLDFGQVNKPEDKIVVIATTPLTGDETWQQLAVGECLVFKDGKIAYQSVPQCPVYLTIEQGLEIAQNAG